MSLWVKICGLTTEAGVLAAVDAGADAIGFVFAPSTRQVTPECAAQLARKAPERVMRVAVMLHPTQALVDEVCSVLRPHVLQTDIEDFPNLRLPQELQRLPVVRGGSAVPEKPPSQLLFEGAVSGAGEISNWAAAAQLAMTTQLVLAGGLTPTNVRDAVEQVRPYGVDVSSGVESQPGVKDPQKIREFVRSARTGASR
jgi:phosphoribosylanthranilate isomerase